MDLSDYKPEDQKEVERQRMMGLSLNRGTEALPMVSLNWAQLEEGMLQNIFPLEVGTVKICCCSVAKSCLTLGDPTDCRTPGSSVLCYLLEFAQIHVY